MSDNKLNVLLDIDATLISAEPAEEYDFNKNRKKSRKFTSHDMDGYYIVFERPGLQEFLEWLFGKFNVSVWTAASKDYALFIIDKIILAGKENRKLDYIFFSYHCDISSLLKSGTKDLTTLWDIWKLPGYHEKNTLILDDYDEVQNTQPGNCIVALPFTFFKKGSSKDKFLPSVKIHLEEINEKLEKGENLQDLVKEVNKKIKRE